MSQKSIIRTYSSGVHFAEVAEYNPEHGVAKLKDARRLWRWKVLDNKGISLSEVALHGLSDESRVCSAVPEMTVAEVIEIIPCSEDAIKSIEAKEVYRP